MSELVSELDKIIEKCTGSDMPLCQAICPLQVDMKGAITLIGDGKFDEALQLIRETLPFAGILGRICTHPCEDVCPRQEVEEPIAIMHLKRSAADYGAEGDWNPSIAEEKSEKIAVIGSGPAGLMAAYELRKMGYQVTIFEALPVLGGMLAVGVPEYRLPRDVLQRELGIIEKTGIQVKLNSRIGDDIKLSELKRDFDAIFLATGAQLSRRLSLEGSEMEGVLWGMDFLREVNLDRKVQMKDRVVVVGGGNVAVDVALTALRMGAKEVQLACLEAREEMPAFEWEIQQALDEGIILNVSWGPKRITGNDSGVESIELVRCTSVFDEEGRFSPSFDDSVTTLIETDMVILAIGQAPDPSILEDSGIQPSQEGFIYASDTTLETGVPGVFAGGDAVYGPKSVIEALASGKKAAISIDRYLRGEDLTADREGEGPQESNLKVSIEGVSKEKRIPMPTLPPDRRKGSFQEIELGFSKEEAKEEAARCLSCECKLCVKDCEFLKLYCETPKELAERLKAGYFREKPKIPYSCNLCDLCHSVCPEDLSVGDACLELRQRLVEEGLGPLPQHNFIDWNVDWATSDSFALAQPDPANGECQRVFFPGCSLSGYSPSLVIKTYDYLRDRLPGTGILLYCCGAPRCDLGQKDKFEEILNGVETRMAELGTSEIIVPCANCYRSFKFFAPQLKVKSLYEVMAEVGLPDGIKTKDWTFTLYDPCTARWEPGIRESVRTLARMTGYGIEEMEHSGELTRCCGTGGMVPYADISLAFKVAKRLTDEAHFDIVTYCATCREMLANPEASGKPTIHILDLIFNPDWEQARLSPPNIGTTRRENQAEVKKLILAKVKN